MPKLLASKETIMSGTRNAYLELHLAVLLFGFTAILGDLLQLNAWAIVWWRVMLTSISMFFVLRSINWGHGLPRSMIIKYMGIGVIVGMHWVAFYGAIKLANASVALICLATASFFTSIIEPLVFRKRIKWYELLLGLLIIPGMALVVQSADTSMYAGIAVGLLSALLAATFATFNKRYIHETDPLRITAIELSSAWIFLTLLLPLLLPQTGLDSWIPSGLDWIYLIVLVLLCTTLAYVLALRALKHLSAFATSLTINLEPVYGIILAIPLLHENRELNFNFYIGGAIIILCVLSYPIIRREAKKRKSWLGW